MVAAGRAGGRRAADCIFCMGALQTCAGRHSPAARTEYSVRPGRRAFFLAMAEALTLATDKATFDAFLRDTYGIEGNLFSVKEVGR